MVVVIVVCLGTSALVADQQMPLLEGDLGAAEIVKVQRKMETRETNRAREQTSHDSRQECGGG